MVATFMPWVNQSTVSGVDIKNTGFADVRVRSELIKPRIAHSKDFCSREDILSSLFKSV